MPPRQGLPRPAFTPTTGSGGAAIGRQNVRSASDAARQRFLGQELTPEQAASIARSLTKGGGSPASGDQALQLLLTALGPGGITRAAQAPQQGGGIDTLREQLRRAAFGGVDQQAQRAKDIQLQLLERQLERPTQGIGGAGGIGGALPGPQQQQQPPTQQLSLIEQERLRRSRAQQDELANLGIEASRSDLESRDLERELSRQQSSREDTETSINQIDQRRKQRLTDFAIDVIRGILGG